MKKVIAIALLMLTAALAPGQTLDQWGGDTAASCVPGGSGTSTYWNTVKQNGHWFACDPAGHPMIAMAVTMGLASGYHDCQTNTFNSTTAALSWAQVSSGVSTNPIYQANISCPGTTSACWTPMAVFQDGVGGDNGSVKGTPLTKCSSCTASPLNLAPMVAGSWFYDGVNTLYVWTTAGDNPSNHTTMNYPEMFDNIYITKYGDMSSNMWWQQEKRVQAWAFNTWAQDSSNPDPQATCSGCVWPGGTNPVKFPFLLELKPSENAAVNRANYAGYSALKDTKYGVVQSKLQDVFGALFDVFDTATVSIPGVTAHGLDWYWQTVLMAYNSSTSIKELSQNDPYIMWLFTDDSDWFRGAGPGPDFVNGDENSNAAWTEMISAPILTLDKAEAQFGTMVLYQDPTNYSKTRATNPAHGTCSYQQPCSLRDFLYDKYSGSISALNTAWCGNSTCGYTSWDSTCTAYGFVENICPGHTAQPAVTLGTGDGTTTTFNVCLGGGTYPSCTALTSAIQPYSMQILVAGTAKIGDCPWWHCGANVTSGNGLFLSPTSGYITAASKINYSTGALTLTFGTAPATGVAITLNYVTGGWQSGGTGLTDESGDGAWVGTNSFCLQGPNPSYPTYFICIGGGNNYEPKPTDAFKISTTTAGTPAIITTTANFSFQDGQAVYITNALSSGCNGGPFTIHVLSANSFSINNASCGTANDGAASANFWANGWVSSAFGVDVDAWNGHYSAQFHKTMYQAFRATPGTCVLSACWPGSKIQYFGVDNVSMYTNHYYLQGEAPWVDGLFEGNFQWAQLQSLQPAEFESAYQYGTQYSGDKPMDNIIFDFAQADSAMKCFPGGQQQPTQAHKGSDYKWMVNYLLTTNGANGDTQFVGFNWWALTDFSGLQQGLISIHDNVYDASEGITSPQTCGMGVTKSGTTLPYYSVQSGYMCGKEAGNFTSGMSDIIAANQIWPTIVSSTPAPGFSASPNPLNFGSINVGASSTATKETITNTGSANLVTGALSSNNSVFAISQDGCSNQTIAAAGLCTFFVTFSPTVSGSQTGVITVPDNTGNTDTVTTTGTGVTASTTTLTVTFAGTGTGLVTSSDGTINCSTQCSATYSVGTVVTLNASPSVGSSFIGWSGGGCTGTGPCVVTMSANTTVNAQFNILPIRGKGHKLIVQ